MSIPFRCSSCGQQYDQPDTMAGRMASCAFCGEQTRVLPAGRIGPPPVRPRGATTSLHAPDLSVLADLEPPTPAEAAQVELPRYAMDFIAPPPKRAPVAAARSRAVPASPSPLPPPALREAPAMPDDDYIDLAAISSAVAVPMPYAAPRATPRRKRDDDDGKLDDVWLLLSDDVARLISALLLVFMLIGTVLTSRSLVKFIAEQTGVPEELSTRFGGYMTLTSGWSLVLFFAVMTPVLLGVCMLACSWTKWTLPDRPYLRAAGTMTVPYLLFFALALGLMHRQFPLVIGVIIVAPFLLVLALKELMGMRWTATLVSALLLVVAMPVAALITSPISWFVNSYALKVASLDPAGVQKWIDEHPEEAAKARLNSRQFARENAPSAGPLPRSSSPTASNVPSIPPAARDPLYDKLAPFIGELSTATNRARTQTREQVKLEYDRLAATILPLKPEKNGVSARWMQVKSMLDMLQREMQKAPSETPPAEVFKPVEDVALRVPRATPDEFRNEDFRFRSVRINPIQAAKVEPTSLVRDTSDQKWILPGGLTVTLAMKPLRDPNQQRPWVADRKIIDTLADGKNLLSVTQSLVEPPTYGRSGGIGWTRITSPVPGRQHDIAYVGRLPDGWLFAEFANGRNYHGDDEIAQLDKFVQGISLVTETPTTQLATPNVALIQRGATSAAPARTVLGSGDLKALLAVVQGDGYSSDKSAALKTLAATPPVPEFRDTIAAALEQIIAADAAFITDDAAEALATWQRPGTVDVMLPLLAENVFPPSKRTRAMRVLAASHDKRAVLPIMRWVLKDTDDVVAALSSMGPVAEDEAINRLREKEPAARSAAARILDAVGTEKSLQPLRRAASDMRDAGAAAAARSALETVSARVKQSKPATAGAPTR
jgi:hypothetical protein